MDRRILYGVTQVAEIDVGRIAIPDYMAISRVVAY